MSCTFARKGEPKSRLQRDLQKKERARGFEPPTYSLGSRDDRVVSGDPQGLTATPPDTSPYASPCDAENVHAADAESRQDNEREGEADRPVDLPTLDLERLADELRGLLTNEQRRRLARMLLGEGIAD